MRLATKINAMTPPAFDGVRAIFLDQGLVVLIENHAVPEPPQYPLNDGRSQHGRKVDLKKMH